MLARRCSTRLSVLAMCSAISDGNMAAYSHWLMTQLTDVIGSVQGQQRNRDCADQKKDVHEREKEFDSAGSQRAQACSGCLLSGVRCCSSAPSVIGGIGDQE